MRVFVHEHFCAGAPVDGSAVASLPTEGWAMLWAVLEDFARCPSVETVTLIDPRLQAACRPLATRIAFHLVERGAEERAFRALAAAADYSLLIAPEFDDILARRCRWVEEAGGQLLGPSRDAIRLTADKLTLARHWLAHGIPTPPVLTALSYPLVCKPRFGAGSQAIFLVHDDEELTRAGIQAEVEGWSGERILQPYVPGLAVSVAFLAGTKQMLALPAVEQHLSTDGRFHYRGGRLPLAEDLDRRARRLAECAVGVVEGLHGYFGVDLVLGEAADAVIEINPRMTTSYIGLRQLARFNLAEALLAVATEGSSPSWRWRTEPVAFRADGRIWGESGERSFRQS